LRGGEVLPAVVMLFRYRLEAVSSAKSGLLAKERASNREGTYSIPLAPNALSFVSAKMPLNALVMTATTRLMSQKLSTITQMMKKMQEMKYPESMMAYMRGDHWASEVRVRKL
jgi:hypothetical protein